MTLAEFVKQDVSAYYAKTRILPKDNAEAGLPPADYIVGNFVSAVAVRDGVIHITFGNQANRHLVGRHLSLRHATVAANSGVPIAWVCASAGVPGKMTVHGEDRTTVPGPHLPLDCRAGPVRS